jgi:hypothetical protein
MSSSSWLDDPAAFGIYILLVGLVVGGLALRSVARGVDSKSWPTVDAQISSASLDPRTATAGGLVRVGYDYIVGARTYSRRETLTVSIPRTREKASRLLGLYQVGGPVEARENPSKPSYAVVRPGVPWETWLWVVIAFGTGLLGVGVLQGWVETT